VSFPHRTWDGLTSQTFDTTTTASQFLESQNQLKLNVPRSPDPNPRHFDRIGLAWMERYYRRSFMPDSNGVLTFDSDPAGGTRVYRIAPFRASLSPPRVSTTDPLEPIELGGIYRSLSTSSAGCSSSVPGRPAALPDRHRCLVRSRRRRTCSTPPTRASTISAGCATTRECPGSDFLLVYFDGFRAPPIRPRRRREHLPAMATAGPMSVLGADLGDLRQFPAVARIRRDS
jgi:hypothetical protein